MRSNPVVAREKDDGGGDAGDREITSGAPRQGET